MRISGRCCGLGVAPLLALVEVDDALEAVVGVEGPAPGQCSRVPLAPEAQLDDRIALGVGGVKPQLMGLGPVVASKKAFAHAGIGADQIDRVEFNEAFSAQVIPSIRELGIPMGRGNVNGGSLGIGHPLGATGARLVGTVAHELRRSGGRYALATQCIGAGMGISTVIERLD